MLNKFVEDDTEILMRGTKQLCVILSSDQRFADCKSRSGRFDVGSSGRG